MKPLQAVILAGGLGTRLKPFTEVIPKPLLPIGEKSLLEIQIAHLKQYGFEEIFLATNYMSQYVSNFVGDGSRYGVKIEVSEEKIPLGTAGPPPSDAAFKVAGAITGSVAIGALGSDGNTWKQVN